MERRTFSPSLPFQGSSYIPPLHLLRHEKGMLTTTKAGVIAAVVAGVVEYTHRRSETASSPTTLHTDITTWFNNDLHGTSAKEVTFV